MPSRIANKVIEIPKNTDVIISGRLITVKGAKGELKAQFPTSVEVIREGDVLKVKPANGGKQANMYAGTWRALTNNMVIGVNVGFERKLLLVGVGFRAQLKGKMLSLALGFSHPIEYPIPDGIGVKIPSPTEIIIQGVDKQKVGQLAAEIRAFRAPEPYKGKGVRYADEVIELKEGKKK